MTNQWQFYCQGVHRRLVCGGKGVVFGSWGEYNLADLVVEVYLAPAPLQEQIGLPPPTDLHSLSLSTTSCVNRPSRSFNTVHHFGHFHSTSQTTKMYSLSGLLMTVSSVKCQECRGSYSVSHAGSYISIFCSLWCSGRQSWCFRPLRVCMFGGLQ